MRSTLSARAACAALLASFITAGCSGGQSDLQKWIAETKSGRRKYSKLLKSDLSHSIEKVGAQLRARMPWLESAKG